MLNLSLSVVEEFATAHRNHYILLPNDERLHVFLLPDENRRMQLRAADAKRRTTEHRKNMQRIYNAAYRRKHRRANVA
jgi:hypothetical protein